LFHEDHSLRRIAVTALGALGRHAASVLPDLDMMRCSTDSDLGKAVESAIAAIRADAEAAEAEVRIGAVSLSEVDPLAGS
jgi:hypothetical protein